MVSILRTARALALAASVSCLATAASGQGSGAAQSSIVAGDLRLEAIAPQQLAPGRCGIFLWAKGTQNPVLVLAVFTNPVEAVINVEGRERQLLRTAFGGQLSHGHFERQTFSNGSITLGLDVTFDTSKKLSDGAMVKQGSMRIKDKKGWETIVPISGLVACPP